MALLHALDSAEAMLAQVHPQPDGSYLVASRSQPGTRHRCGPTTCDCEAGARGKLCWHKEAVRLYRRQHAQKEGLRGVPFCLPVGDPFIGTRQEVREYLAAWGCWADGKLWFTPARPLRLRQPGDEARAEVPPGLAIASLLCERWEGNSNPTVRELQEWWIGAMTEGYAERNRRERCE